MNIMEFQARYERHMAYVLRARERRIKRAALALSVASAQLTEERRRAREAIAALESICESFRGQEPSKAWYTAIVALLRAKRALGIT